MSTPGRIAAATPSDAAVSAHDSSRRSGLNRGRSGCQETASPYEAGAGGAVIPASFAARFSSFFAARCAFCSATLTLASP